MHVSVTADRVLVFDLLMAIQVKHKDAVSIRDKRNKGTDEDWLSSLSWVLLGTRPVMKASKFVESVEVIAFAVDGTRIELNFRQNISGITVRSISISLA